MKINSTADLRNYLLERMVNLAEGKEPLAASNAAAALAKQVNTTLLIELHAARLLQSGASLGALRITG